MRRLRPGQGLRLVDEDGQETAARVAWISPLTSRLLIVNRRGVRKMVVSPEELAALVGNGHASVRSVDAPFDERSEEHTSELQSLMRNSYAVFCLKNQISQTYTAHICALSELTT